MNIKSEKPLVRQTFTNKMNYIRDNRIESSMASKLLMLTSKTVFIVKTTSEKVVACKFCEKFGINCTVRVSGNDLYDARQGVSANANLASKEKIDEHFKRMMSRFLK